MRKIDVIEGGPIEGTFTINLTPGYGAYEFRGKRGSGKSTCIASLDLLAGHKVDLTLHDGALSGKVEGFGVVAPIGGRKRRKGEMELDTIDSEKFSLTDILAPQGKTPEVRDATRIKAIASLSDTKADPTLYYDLCGGPSKCRDMGLAPTNDPVVLATRIKAAFDKAATQAQRTADAEAKHAAPLEHVPDDLDMAAESDLTVLGKARDKARDTAQGMRTDRENGQAAERKAAEAKTSVGTAEAAYEGPAVVDANKAYVAASDTLIAARKARERHDSALRVAEENERAAEVACNAKREAREAAASHASAISGWRNTIDAGKLDFPDEEGIANAEKSVDAATEAYNQGIRIRDVKQNQIRAKAHRGAANEAEKEAAAARNKAGEVFDILAQSLNTKHLEIKSVDGNPRLFVQHPKRGRCAFDRVNGLSQGERVDFTLRELLPHIKSPGLLPIPQECWQDLQPSDRKNLHNLAVERGLYIFGAQIDDFELRVVYLGDELALTDNPTQGN